MKRYITILVVMLLMAVCVVGCGGGDNSGGNTQSDTAAITSTMNGFNAAYNAQDYNKCLDYMTGWTDKAATVSMLQMAYSMTGAITIVSIGNISVTGSTATASATSSSGGEPYTKVEDLKNVGGTWKLVYP